MICFYDYFIPTKLISYHYEMTYLSSYNNFYLKINLFDIITILELIILLFAWDMLSHPSTFNLPVHLYLNCLLVT